jgi:hypothetical protein
MLKTHFHAFWDGFSILPTFTDCRRNQVRCLRDEPDVNGQQGFPGLDPASDSDTSPSTWSSPLLILAHPLFFRRSFDVCNFNFDFLVQNDRHQHG